MFFYLVNRSFKVCLIYRFNFCHLQSVSKLIAWRSVLSFWLLSLVSSSLSSVRTKDALFAIGLFFIALTILVTLWGPIVVTILYANFDAGDRLAAWTRCKLDHSYLWYEFPASCLASSFAKSALDPKVQGTPAVRTSRVCGHILPSALSSYHWKCFNIISINDSII